MRPEPDRSLLFQEAAAAAEAVRAQSRGRNAQVLLRLASSLRSRPPRAAATCARGSSDHAATFAKYLIETRAGVLTASTAPAVNTLYRAPLDLRDCLFLVISQSGRSPDLVAATRAARESGAIVVALVNAEDAPLADVADFTLALCASPEHGIAATKSYIASLAAIVHLVAAWTGDSKLSAALADAPAKLDEAWQLDWTPAVAALRSAEHLYVIGRGTGFAIAQEAALKLKEVCGLHAEPFSGAEVRHGPQALLGKDFPVLLFAQDDETLPGLVDLAGDLVARGVPVIVAGARVAGALELPSIAAHPAIEPMLLAQSFYRLANALAVARGRDPDRPPHLTKVTSTL